MHDRILGRTDDMIIFRAVNIYPGQIATVLEVNLSDIAERNIEKLQSRAQRGVIQGSGDNR